MALREPYGSRRPEQSGSAGSRSREGRRTAMTRVLVVEDDPQLVRAFVINMQVRR